MASVWICRVQHSGVYARLLHCKLYCTVFRSAMKWLLVGLLSVLVVVARADEDEAEGEDGVEFEDNTIFRY